MTNTEPTSLDGTVHDRLAGKTAIVTGAPRSIGRAIAVALANEGASIVVHYRSRRDEAEATVTALEAIGADAIAVGGELSNSAEVTALFEQAVARFGGVDIVVANAGATAPNFPVASITDDSFTSLVQSNTLATFYVLREAARTVRDGGRIVNISSSSVRFPAPGFAAYATSKSGALTTIAILATELGARGVTANSVMAGPIRSGFLDPSGPLVAGAPAGTMEFLASAAPAGRLGQPTDIAPIVAFLAGPDSGWINGQTILANNGGPI